MSETLWGVIIGGAIGIAGPLLTSLLNFFLEGLKEKRAKKRKIRERLIGYRLQTRDIEELSSEARRRGERVDLQSADLTKAYLGARVRDKAIASQSAGRALPPRRLAQVLLSVGLTVGIAAGLSLFYTPVKIKAVLRWFNPLWTALERVLWWVAALMIIILEPLLRWLMGIFRHIGWGELVKTIDSEGVPLFEPRQVQPSPEMLMFWTIVRYLAIGLVIVLVLGFVLLYLNKISRSQLDEDAEKESDETITLGGGMLNRGAQWLRDVSNLVRRYGLSRQLLAAVSVQNIYANLCRIASQRGYPRYRAWPPDDYLPTLKKAFSSEAEEALSRITLAYMRVHYGDKPVGMAELARLRKDYHLVRLMKPEAARH